MSKTDINEARRKYVRRLCSVNLQTTQKIPSNASSEYMTALTSYANAQLSVITMVNMTFNSIEDTPSGRQSYLRSLDQGIGSVSQSMFQLRDVLDGCGDSWFESNFKTFIEAYQEYGKAIEGFKR